MTVKEIATRMNRLLEPAGFFRRGKVWNRRRHPFVDVIDLQKSKAGDAVTINVGVLDQDVSAVLEDRAPSEFVQHLTCTVGARIGELIDGRDKWWQIDSADVADELTDNIGARALPFLERMHAHAAMRQWLISTNVSEKRYSPPIINLAILECFLGDAARGCAILAELQKTTPGAWKVRAAEVAVRLHCAEGSNS
jgi:hypothetical protein